MTTSTDSPETFRRLLAVPCRLALVSILAATGAAHAAGTIDITAPDTFSPGGNAVRVEAGIVDGAGVQEARLYFRGDLDDDFVFSAMRSDGERFIGRIPAPDAAVRTIEYQLLVVNGANETYTSQVLAMTAGEAAQGEWQEVASTEEAEISAEYLEATAPKSFPASAGRFDIADTARWYGRVARIYRTAQLAGSPTGSAALAKDAGTILATRTAPAASSTTAESGSNAGDASTANVSSGGMNWGTIALGALGAVGAAAALGGGGDDGESGSGSVTPTTGSYQFGGSVSGVAADGSRINGSWSTSGTCAGGSCHDRTGSATQGSIQGLSCSMSSGICGVGIFCAPNITCSGQISGAGGLPPGSGWLQVTTGVPDPASRNDYCQIAFALARNGNSYAPTGSQDLGFCILQGTTYRLTSTLTSQSVR